MLSAKVARDEDLKEQIGKDIYFDLVDHDKVLKFQIQKQMPFNLFKEEVAKELGIPVKFQRFWIWGKRENHTYRPYRPLTPQEELQAVSQLKEVSNEINDAELKLFLEVDHGTDLVPSPPPDKSKDDILLFFKLYDPEKEELRYIGRLFVKSTGKPIEILPKLNEMAGFAPDQEVELFEEIKFDPIVMCERIDREVSFRLSQIGDGDIICFQKKARFPDVPSFLEFLKIRQVRLKEEQEEKERRYQSQAHLYKIIKVARDEDLKEQIGKDIYFDLVDHDKVRSFRIEKQMPFNLFKEEVAKELGIPVKFQRFWIWGKRENHTYRPCRPLTPQEELQAVGQLRDVSNKTNKAELKLFLEVDHGMDLVPRPPPDKSKDDILLFFKLYDPEKEELRYIGRLFVKSNDKPIEILPKLKELAGFAPDQEVELFEEIKFEPSVMCERIEREASFRFNQIQDGDIICFQKKAPPEVEEQVPFPDVPSFLEYVNNCQVRLKEEQEEKERRYQAQPHLYRIIKVARDEDLKEQIGKDMYFDLVDHDKVYSFRIQKKMPFNLFKEEVAKELGIPVQFQRFWIWGKRENHTYRPYLPLTRQEELQAVGQLREVSNKTINAELKLFLEVDHGMDLVPRPPPDKSKDDILLFFKLYDPEKEELRYVGRLFVKSTDKPIEILPKLKEMVGFAPDQEVELFEEVKFEPSVMCERLDREASFRFSQIGDGDIICLQKKSRFPDVPSFLEYVKERQVRLREEQEEKERRYQAQGHLYKIIKVARDEDLKEQIGKGIYFDLVDHDEVHSFRIQKQMPFNLFKEEVAKELGIPVQFQRFWIWGKRQNHTYRPYLPLTRQEELQAVGQLREVSNKTNNAELKLFLEVDHGIDLVPRPPPDKSKDDILLFFKLYDPEKENLRYVGRLFVKSTGKPIEILSKLNEMAGFAPDQEVELFEEIKFEPIVMCERLDREASFQFSQIQDGDIICFQKKAPPEVEEQVRFPDVPSFFKYVKNRQLVCFRALEKPEEDDFYLELAKTDTYDEVMDRVAQRLGVDDSSKIRLTPHDCYSQQPQPNPIEYLSVDNLLDMLTHYDQISYILYYEVLDMQENEGDASSCIVCYEAPIDGACVPCGHMAGCMSCLNKIKDNSWGCPVCRTTIESVLRLYAV